MMRDQLVVALAALPVAAVAGVLCVVLAAAYARCIDHGAVADNDTLRLAFRLAWRALFRRVGRCTAPVSRALAALCAGLLALACLPFVLHPSFLTAAYGAACVMLLLLALIDARCGLLPDALTLSLLWAGLLLAWAGVGVSLHDAVAGAAAGYLLLRGMDAAFQVWRGCAGLGGGDMKLVAALGAWLGWAPLPGVLLAACLAGIAFAVFGRGRRAWRNSLAFGPFLAVAGAFGLVGGPVVQFLF